MALPRASLAGISLSVLESLRLPEQLSYMASIINDCPLERHLADELLTCARKNSFRANWNRTSILLGITSASSC